MILSLLAAGLAAQVAPPQVTVEREGDTWLATYRLPERRKAWVFNRTNTAQDTGKSWRVGHWQVLDGGVRLVDLDGQDALVATGNSVPRTVRIRFTPHFGELNAGYEPALAFSDGPLALFTGQFDVKPAGAGDGLINHLTIDAPGDTILVEGKRYRGRVSLVDQSTYALIGDADPITTPYLTAFVDPGLPDWARDDLVAFMPATLRYYANSMGPRGARRKPTILVSWRGATPQMAGLSGAALPGMIAMAIEGEGVVQPDRLMGGRMRWFIAHEAAHFWLGQVVQYDKEGDAWIMEGGADVAAIRAVSDLDPDFDARAEEQREWRECEAALHGGTLESARLRGDFKMPYTCGAVLMMGAEAVNDGDYFAFVRRLFDAGRGDGFVSTDEWLAVFGRAGASREAVALARQIAVGTVSDPARTLADFARATGVELSPSATTAPTTA